MPQLRASSGRIARSLDGPRRGRARRPEPSSGSPSGASARLPIVRHRSCIARSGASKARGVRNREIQGGAPRFPALHSGHRRRSSLLAPATRIRPARRLRYPSDILAIGISLASLIRHGADQSHRAANGSHRANGQPRRGPSPHSRDAGTQRRLGRIDAARQSGFADLAAGALLTRWSRALDPHR